jgi:GAF domain-containing protein
MAGLDLHETLTRLIGEASRISGAPHVAVLLRDEGARTLRLTAHIGYTFPPGHELELGQSISGLVAARGEPIFVANVVDDPRNSIPDRDRAAGIVAYLGLPIKAASTVLGVLVLKTTAPRAFDREELAILASFAQQAAIAIENARLYAALHDRVERLDLFTGLNRLISDSLDVDRILKQIADAAAALMGAGLVIVWTADEGRQVIQARASSDDTALSAHPHPTKRFGEGVMGWVVQNRRPLSVPDLAADPRVESSRWFVAHHFRSGLALPILRGDGLLGGLSLLFQDSLPANLEDDPLLRAFIDQAGIAIEHARLYAAESAARQAAERALAEVTHLQGMLPICSYCKKIRNEQNSWEQLERYISEHSHATFSHGICPECRNTVVARQLEQWQGAR